MTLSKETLEPASPLTKAASTSAPAKPDLNRLRADAVSLDVPVRVHGSRVTEVVRGTTPHTEPFEEEASTMIVFPHGGVVRMATAVNVGQMLVLTNLRSNQDAICRVVKVRAYSNTQAYVEVEFTHRQQGYWGVHFPADDEDTIASAAPPPAQPATADAEKKPLVSSVTVKVENLPKPAQLAKTESAFAPIGSHEDIQPAATHTEAKPRVPAPAPPPVRLPAQPVQAVAPPPAKVAPPMRLEEPELADAEPAGVEPPVQAAQPSRTFGTLTGGGTERPAPASPSEFGVRLDSAVSGQAQTPVPHSGNWMWIAACVFFLVAGLAGGAVYFRQHPFGAPSAASQNVNSLQPIPQNSAPVVVPPANGAVSAAQSSAPTTTPDQPVRPSIESQPQPAAPAQVRPSNSFQREAHLTAPPTPAPNYTASDARLVARQIETGAVAAPTVGSAPAAAGAMPDVLGSASAAPAPPPPPLVRVRVGGVIVAPKLVHSVAPNYPSGARQAGISGNVVIDAQLDKSGNVSSMKVVSGPPTLQSAAMVALKQWKYRPATLDGVPTATEITVTIKFQQQ
ncbi:MAG TPA: TonB family protein [Candidatus Aquilonibacter sp.]|nr:TonB family protein [Candidatus Aquilonibacter sp.]